MNVEINIEYLLKNKLSANEFLILQLILEKQDERLKKFKEIVGEDYYMASIRRLLEVGYLQVISDGFEVTTECLRTFKGKGYFEELYAAFPVSVVRPDGKRESLRTDRKRCATKYNRLAKRKDVHEHILKCLEYEIKDRTRNNSTMYMKKMPNWLSSEAWKEYEEKMIANEVIDNILEEDSYGTKLL